MFGKGLEGILNLILFHPCHGQRELPQPRLLPELQSCSNSFNPVLIPKFLEQSPQFPPQTGVPGSAPSGSRAVAVWEVQTPRVPVAHVLMSR